MSGRTSPSSTPTTSPASRRGRERARGRDERPLLLLALLAVGALGALYLAVVRTYWGQRLDEHAFAGRGLLAGEPSQGADRLLSAISEGTLVLAVIALVVLALLRRRPGLAALAFAVVAGSLLVTEALKHEILTRPPLVDSAVLSNSFPSGHTTIGVAVGLATLLIVPPRLRGVAALGAAALAAAVGVATVAAGWHRPSDAVAAYLVAVAVTALLVAAAIRWVPAAVPSRRESTGPQDGEGRLAWLGIAGVIVAIVALTAAGLTFLALLRTIGTPWSSAGVGFLLSAAAIAAAAVLAVAALVLALRASEGRADEVGRSAGEEEAGDATGGWS